MSLVLVLLVTDFGNLHRPLLWRPPAGSTNYYFDPYPPDEILPTPLPNEWSCWGCCCLFPLAGGIIGYNVLKEKPTRLKKKRLNFGINYSLGSAVDGIGYARRELFPENVENMFYWVNRIGMTVSYSPAPSWELEIGLGYLWGRVIERESVFSPVENGQHPHFTNHSTWEISCYNPAVMLRFMRGNNKFLMVGVEFYLVKALNYEEKAYTFEKVTITTQGVNPGGFFGVGVTPDLMSFLKLDLSILARLGCVRNPSYEGTEKVIRREDFSLSFSGLYLQIGVKSYLPIPKGG